MATYRFTQRYASSITAGDQDAEIECTEEFAALVNNDAPGTLVAIETPNKTRSLDSPPSDRMVHTAARKRNDREPGQPIDKSTYKAVKRP